MREQTPRASSETYSGRPAGADDADEKGEATVTGRAALGSSDFRTCPGRLAEIDILKGIGIFSVVLGHLPISNMLLKYIHSFHMPLFFIVAGYLFKPATSGWHKMLKKRTSSLLVPYLLFSVIGFVYFLIVDCVRHGMAVGQLRPVDRTVSFVSELAQGTIQSLKCNPPMWFLPCLFLALIFFSMMRSGSSKNRTLAILFVASGLLGIVLNAAMNFNMYWTLNAVPTAIFFMGVGYLYHSAHWDWSRIERFPLLLPPVFIATVISSYYCDRLDLSSNALGMWGVSHATAIAGVWFWLMVSRRLSTSSRFSWLGWMGRNSLTIMGLHVFSNGLLKQVYAHTVGRVSVSGLEKDCVLLLIAVCSVGVIAAAIWCSTNARRALTPTFVRWAKSAS